MKQSEEVLDKYFPKGDKRRGEALVIFASLVNELEGRFEAKIKKWLNKFKDNDIYTGRVIKFEGKINLLEESK